jgi:hypothetical protein
LCTFIVFSHFTSQIYIIKIIMNYKNTIGCISVRSSCPFQPYIHWNHVLSTFTSMYAHRLANAFLNSLFLVIFFLVILYQEYDIWNTWDNLSISLFCRNSDKFHSVNFIWHFPFSSITTWILTSLWKLTERLFFYWLLWSLLFFQSLK